MTAYHDRRLAGHYDPPTTKTEAEAEPTPKRKPAAKTTAKTTPTKTTRRKRA